MYIQYIYILIYYKRVDLKVNFVHIVYKVILITNILNTSHSLQLFYMHITIELLKEEHKPFVKTTVSLLHVVII